MSRGLLRSNRERTVCVRGACLSRCRSSLVFDAIFRVCGTYSSAACSPGTDLVVNADALEFWIRGCIGTYHMCSVSLSLGRGCSGNSLRKHLLSQLSAILPSFPIPKSY